MDLAANKALTIATAVFITIIITSSILFSISQMRNIYEQVYETDVSIQNRFTEYEAFDNTIKTGIDIKNAAKKYRDSNLVKVYLSPSSTPINTTSAINNLDTKLGTAAGETLYNASVVEKDGKVKITFVKK